MNKFSDDILCKVEKPSRYVGGELNQVIKDYEYAKNRAVKLQELLSSL